MNRLQALEAVAEAARICVEPVFHPHKPLRDALAALKARGDGA
jgi:hypothetical protein